MVLQLTMSMGSFTNYVNIWPFIDSPLPPPSVPPSLPPLSLGAEGVGEGCGEDGGEDGAKGGGEVQSTNMIYYILLHNT